MAKNTHSQEILTGTPDSYTEHEQTDPNVTQLEVEGDTSLTEDGTDSLESSGSEQTSSGNEKTDPQPPAQTTENPSKGTGTAADSDADTTDGAGPKGTQPRSGKATTASKSTGKARSRTIGNDDDFD